MPTVEVEHRLSPEHQAQLDKLKVIVKNNWKPFFVGAGIAGITCLIMKGRHAVLLKGADGPSQATVRPFFLSIFASRSGNVVTTIHNGGRGHPGFRVRNLDHMLDFDTQGAAARAFKIPENVMSMHLNERIPDAYGLSFERIAI